MSNDALVVLEVRGLRHSFGEAPVLDDVSLKLERGQVTLLMGPSGSGKSTLLAILSGLLRPDEGEVWVRPAREAICRPDAIFGRCPRWSWKSFAGCIAALSSKVTISSPP